MKNKILSTLIIFLFNYLSFSQSLNSDQFESEISNCYYQKYNAIVIDLKHELLQFEKYLIKTGQLKDSSGESYIEIFKKIVKLNNVPFLIDLNKYDIKNNTPENYPLFTKCFHSKINDKNLKNSGSKLNDIFSVMKKVSKNPENSLSEFAKGILTVLNAEDFEKEFFKIWALNTFYFTSDLSTD
ncbi:hypothetical protein [uncultured Tenacibaculum sp.]|uniref:hypothetical protein n=1 Tax=uncultured Tenacibaculum sp. TaxID=174713 RepID=UPI0026166990|nr:hypothetical protein [uncultured Tenacibaculum sp.]